MAEYLNDIYNNFKKGRDFFYGWGCFETIAGYNKKIIFFDEHIERLEKAKKILGINRKDNYKEIAEKLIEIENLKENEEFFLKIKVDDENLYMKLERIKLRYEENGINLCMIDKYYQNELGFIKSTNYILNILAREEIKQKKSYEGIFKNREGFITEGSISNVFLIKNNIVKTPSLSLNILDGISRRKIIEICEKNKIKIEEGFYKVNDLFQADSIFITNSLMKNGFLYVNNFCNCEKSKNKILDLIEKDYLKIM